MINVIDSEVVVTNDVVVDNYVSPAAVRVQAWVDRENISARSALVTILGDTVVPLGGTVWLNDLITMASLFGFNERLVRTSMFRHCNQYGWYQSTQWRRSLFRNPQRRQSNGSRCMVKTMTEGN